MIELLPARSAPGAERQARVTPARFEIDTRIVDGVCRVSVRGELDLATGPELGRRLGELGTTQSAPIEVDLAEVSFIDARGLRVLIEAHDRSNGPGRTGLSLVRPSRATRRVFELTGTTWLLDPPAVD